MKRHLRFSALSVLLMGLIACSQSPSAESSQPSTSVAASPIAGSSKPASSVPASPAASSKASSNGDLTQLFSRVWRVTKAPSTPASGSIYTFLPNGTLLQTSCVEPYRISTWTIDKNAPRVLRVVEDGQLAFTATISQLSDTTLQLQQTLVRSNEKRAITLSAVQQEFVCPDLPKR
ncbi:MAG: hypothetical protein KME13_15045 [Myxacorys californica WJT36-NPBG1]|jgi:lipoprotein-anchoring transpeptidase ErfK/SrfK|nr:hypothetical protein [Myxacorys californica WJT36-NPBG1]